MASQSAPSGAFQFHEEEESSTSEEEQIRRRPRPQTQQLPGASSSSSSSAAKQLFVDTQMRAREAEFTQSMQLGVVCGTWNVNGKAPGETLDKWLVHEMASSPAIVCCGFQELDLSASALVLNETAKAEPWIRLITATILTYDSYQLVAKQQLGGVLLAVWVRQSDAAALQEVESAYAATGVFNVVGNKGGVAVRLKLYDSTFCFVNSHLNAHLENLERRNQDYHSISQGISFLGRRSIWDADFLFWVGDLNYRIELPRSTILQLVEEGNFSALLERDQLREQRRRGLAFERLTEEEITWAPTYKYDSGTNVYDTSEKARRPSYTDRIFYRVPASKIRVHSYQRAELLTSDHKPVYMVCEVTACKVVTEERGRVFAEVMREVERMRNDFEPRAKLSPHGLDFGEVRYGVAAKATLSIRNVGNVLLKYSFTGSRAASDLPRWLWVEPSSGSIMPGEESDEVHVTLSVDDDTAADLNAGKASLDTVLMLRVEGGKDFFVSVSGNFQRTCFVTTLEDLCLETHPVRQKGPRLAPESALRVPKEIWCLVDYVYEHGANLPQLFLAPAREEEMQQVRELLDVQGSLETFEGSGHAAAQVLLRFLEALPHPCVPVMYYSRVVDAGLSFEASKALIQALPPAHYNVWWYLVSFLRELLKGKYAHGVSAPELADVFGQVLVRPPSDKRFSSNVEEHQDQVREFLLRFLKQ